MVIPDYIYARLRQCVAEYQRNPRACTTKVKMPGYQLRVCKHIIANVAGTSTENADPSQADAIRQRRDDVLRALARDSIISEILRPVEGALYIDDFGRLLLML